MAADYNRFEAKIHELREQLIINTNVSGSLKTIEKRTLYVRWDSITYYAILHVHCESKKPSYCCTVIVKRYKRFFKNWLFASIYCYPVSGDRVEYFNKRFCLSVREHISGTTV